MDVIESRAKKSINIEITSQKTLHHEIAHYQSKQCVHYQIETLKFGDSVVLLNCPQDESLKASINIP